MPAVPDARVVVVGEALVDVVHSSDGTVSERPGGSPANVAVGLARLGLPVTLRTAYGDDARGLMLGRHLRSNGVAPQVTPMATSVAHAHVDADGHARYDIGFRWQLDPDQLLEAALVHVGSVAATAGRDVIDLVRSVHGRALVSYDPNCRPQVMGPRHEVARRAEELVSLADIVKASDEDLRWLQPDAEPLDTARQWLALGPTLVVVTLGARGALALTKDGVEVVPAPDGCPVVDTVGAGDAFMAGLLWALLTGRPDALADAALVARMTCERLGADPPRLAELAGRGAL